MRAIVYDQYGTADVLRVEACEAPSPKAGHARIEVHAAALNPKDVLVRKGKMRWLVGGERRRTPGYDVAGVLLDDAPDLPAGTEVYGMLPSHQGGGCAEVISLGFDHLTRKPKGLTMIEAASLPLAALTAIQALRDEIYLQPGHRVLLNGASGGVGTLAVQIARAWDAHVIAVCSSRNAAMVKELGAHEVLDYTVDSLDDLRDLDGIFDIFGSFPWERARHALKPGGRYCTTIPKPANIARDVLRRLGVHRAAMVNVKSRKADLDILRDLVETGAVRPIVDKVFSMEDAAEGHRYIETKRARGKVVIDLREEPQT